MATTFKTHAFDLNFKGNLSSFSLKDKNIKNYGSQEDLLRSHGITEEKIESVILRYSK